MYRHRTLETYLSRVSNQFPVLLVTGARQVGKSTLLRKLAEPGRTIVTLDDPLVLNLARSDPALFFQRFTPPLVIDEIQYAPGLLPYIKMQVDLSQKPGLFWLTGSQQFHLMKGVSESLAGRIGIVQLLGLSRAELAGRGLNASPFIPTVEELEKRSSLAEPLLLNDLYRMIWLGGFPPIALNAITDRSLYYGSYVQTYLQRDVHDLARVGDEMAFFRFLRASAARTGQLLNVADLARDADVAVNTAKSWLAILLASGVIYLLEPYHTNLTKRMVKAPKLYFLDTGLCSYLTEWSSPETLEAGAMSGAILETWIMSELLKSYLHNGQRAPFYYYRDKDQKEIDLLIVRDGTIYPLEFKKTASPGQKDVQHFRLLGKLNMPTGFGGVICLTETYLPLTESAASIPVALI